MALKMIKSLSFETRYTIECYDIVGEEFRSCRWIKKTQLEQMIPYFAMLATVDINNMTEEDRENFSTLLEKMTTADILIKDFLKKKERQDYTMIDKLQGPCRAFGVAYKSIEKQRPSIHLQVDFGSATRLNFHDHDCLLKLKDLVNVLESDTDSDTSGAPEVSDIPEVEYDDYFDGDDDE